MLEPGDDAPDFTLSDQHGNPVSLSELDGPVVLYFYPRADTPGCTTEACEFRDNWDAFEGVHVLGVSNDPVEDLRAFAEKRELPHTLLSDPDGEVATTYESYGTVDTDGEEREIAQRNTYLIGEDGTIRAVFEDVSPEGHATELLAALERQPEP